MVALGLLELYLLVATAGISFFGFLNVFRPDFSSLVNDLVTYGKSVTNQDSKLLKWVAVPKRWFSHFYLVATFTSLFWLTIVGAVHMEIIQVDRRLVEWLRMGSKGVVKIRPEAALLFCGLICLHAIRRLVETMVVSVYSDTQMNVLHYLIGLIHYVVLPISVVCETVGIASRDKFVAHFDELSNLQILGIAAFVWFSYHQHQCAQKLAKMRKNHHGNITNYAHGIAYGGFFDFVSCPHFAYEVLIYLSLFATLGFTGRCFTLILVFVTMNQTIAALITHRWYQERFGEKYPTKRRALIPYLI